MRSPAVRAVVALNLFVAFLVVAVVLHSNRRVTNFGDELTITTTGSKITRETNGENLITDCITKKVLGRIPQTLEVVRFAGDLNKSTENGQQRLASFQKVFNKKEWINEGDDPNVVSGSGSSLAFSQEAMAGLHAVISDIKRQFGLSRIRMLDIPCGDMTWMSRFLQTRDDIDYTGYDIVPELIAKHKVSFKDHPWKFSQHDIAEKPITDAFDLVFSRMMLQHLLTRDVLKILTRFSDSGSKYLLTTTFSRISQNQDLDATSKGRFRLLNLEIPPVSLVPPICTFKDGPGDAQQHFLALWKLPLQKIRDCKETFIIKITGKSYNVHSCTNWAVGN